MLTNLLMVLACIVIIPVILLVTTLLLKVSIRIQWATSSLSMILLLYFIMNRSSSLHFAIYFVIYGFLIGFSIQSIGFFIVSILHRILREKFNLKIVTNSSISKQPISLIVLQDLFKELIIRVVCFYIILLPTLHLSFVLTIMVIIIVNVICEFIIELLIDKSVYNSIISTPSIIVISFVHGVLIKEGFLFILCVSCIVYTYINNLSFRKLALKY